MTHYTAICDGCRQIHTFATEEGRELWVETHECEGRVDLSDLV